MATDKQYTFITKLQGERQLDPDISNRLSSRISARDLTVQEASKTIEWLLARPQKAGIGGSFATSIPSELTELEGKIPEGRYCVNLLDHGKQPDESGNVWKFYVVDKPNEQSKWHGRTFVSQQVSNDKWPMKDPAGRLDVLRMIEKDSKKALLQYGQKLGRCGHCGRTLTNDESREIGIGPVCRGKDGARWGL